MAPNIWIYWEGHMPLWIHLCILSMKRVFVGCTVHMVTRENCEHFLQRKLPQNFDRLLHASQRSEYLRAALLTEHGGFYFDADTIGLRSPEGLARLYGDSDLVFSMWNKEPARVVTAYIYARKGSPITSEWLEKSTQLIHDFTSERGIGWLDLSEEILSPIVAREHKIENEGLVLLPLHTFLPVDIDADPSVLFSDRDPNEFIKPDSICFGTNNSWMSHYHSEILNSDPRTWSKSPHLILKLLARYL